jgi:flagellar basal-body rod protein FlgC
MGSNFHEEHKVSLFNIFDIAGSAMSAQTVRLNTTASNLANANSVAASAAEAYRSRQPVFQTVLDEQTGDPATASVRVTGIVQSDVPPARVFQPGHPAADEEGYVYMSNVNVVDEMVNMISASRAYQNSVEVLNTSKELMLRTLSLGQ